MTVPGSVGRPAYRLYQLAWSGLDWLYPPSCGGCDKPGARWCAACHQATPKIVASLCPRCGTPQANVEECVRCKTSPPPYAALRAYAFFNGLLRKAIHRLKYERDIALGDTLAHYLVDLLCQQPWQIDLVTPVPVGVARRAQRGYNQSALLALPLAMICNIDYQPRALQRIRETISQVGLTATERRENVRGAFQARSELVSGRRILVVDDVTTSGATMEICAQALMQAGASRVYGLTLARANWQS